MCFQVPSHPSKVEEERMLAQLATKTATKESSGKKFFGKNGELMSTHACLLPAAAAAYVCLDCSRAVDKGNSRKTSVLANISCRSCVVSSCSCLSSGGGRGPVFSVHTEPGASP